MPVIAGATSTRRRFMTVCAIFINHDGRFNYFDLIIGPPQGVRFWIIWG